MKTYTGRRRSTYILEDKPLGVGGEGSVYRILGETTRVAKIYDPQKKFKTEAARQELHEKLESMIFTMRIKPVVDQMLRIAWPEDILFENGKFVGYVMPLVSLPYKIYEVTRDDRTRIFPDYTWKYSVQYAYNLSWLVWYLHMNGIVVGDMNMNNIMVGPAGEVIFIDCDSFDIRDRKTGRHFKCEVGMPELLAPELQTVGNLANGTFTKESDDFSLAIHLFRLLMNNADPFCYQLVGRNVQSQSAIPANQAIVNGEAPFFRHLPNKVVPDWAPQISFLPDDLVQAFDNTFNYTQLTSMRKIRSRTTAEEWCRLLLKYAQQEPNHNLQTCRRNSHHVYPLHHKTCPFCSTTTSKTSGRDRLKGLFG